MNSHSTGEVRVFRARIVGLIAGKRPEEALRMLSEYYRVPVPRLRVGTVRGHRNVLACYVDKEARIYLSNSSFLGDPFVVLHEFYHHLRASGVQRHRQVEKRADQFATSFIRDFLSLNEPIRVRERSTK